MSWGFHLILDLYDCNPDKIRDAEFIKQFVKDLCERIKMTRFGETVVVNFGKDPNVSGYSMFQLIEESNISAHFIENIDAVCLDIFSCKKFDILVTKDYCQKQFEAKDIRFQYIERLKK